MANYFVLYRDKIGGALSVCQEEDWRLWVRSDNRYSKHRDRYELVSCELTFDQAMLLRRLGNDRD